MMTEQGKILRFWRDVEIFNIPSPSTKKDQTNPGKNSRLTVTVEKYMEPKALPWPPAASAPQDKSVEHAIYLGVQDMSPLAVHVLKTITSEEKLEEKDLENIFGQGCLGVFCVNQDGVPLEKTYTAASFVLGVEAYRNGTSLDGLTRRLDEAQKNFDERRFALKLAEDPNDGGTAETVASEAVIEETEPEEKPEPIYIPLTWQELREECRILFDCLGLKLPAQINITIKTTKTSVREGEPKGKGVQPRPEILNSFYLNDLDTLIRQCDQNEPFGKTLSAYLGSPSDKGLRRDILKDHAAMFSMLNPDFMPSGRWPSLSKNHLSLGQQAAVSGILARVAGKTGGLVAVNGPPGTGKTTLLSDIIAEVVVRRAENICKYEKPWLIFDDKILSNGRSIFPLKNDIARQTGIVVSSNNNSAVENITLDLPSSSKIESKEHSDAKYFREVINAVFSRFELEPKAWGLIAGALGNWWNRKRFFDGFLGGSADTTIKGMKNLLNATPKDKSTQEKWNEVKKKFLSLKSRIDAHKTEFRECYQAIQLIPRLRLRLHEVEQQLREIKNILSSLDLDKDNNRAEIEKARLNKPGIFHRLLGSFGLKTQTYLAWVQQQKKALQAFQTTLQKLKEAQTRKGELQAEKERLEADLGRQDSKVELTRQNFAAKPDEQDLAAKPDEQDLAVKPDKQNFAAIPDEQFFEDPPTVRHLRHVWTTNDFDKLRAQYFLAALELHEATVFACSGKFSANFTALSSMLTAKGYFSPEVRVALWDSLFFTVPVISTSLASFDRLFIGMGQDSIGWLLIDEAGQATPQSVVGALWRSQRAVIIGDPLQIEPVLPIPEQLVDYIQKKYNLGEDWSPKPHSAQTLADRTMEVGAWVGSGETAVWTGLPLRAHRRCADPMFSVSNHIAYDGQMVQTHEEQARIESCLGQSRWFNVQATANDGQIVKAELDELRNLLKRLRKDWLMVSGDKRASVYIISPFRRVAAECRHLVEGLGLKNDIQAGTVHTFQGKEADIVFIVLGSAPGRAGVGSRNWASEKPNLLNVALTRAKLLVYVIGNQDDWKTCRSFNKLADALEKKRGSESA